MDSANFALADAVLSAKGRSFHWARHFLGRRHAARATRLYMLCRYVDDIADESGSGQQALAALSRIKQQVRSGSVDDSVIADGLDLFDECGIDQAVFLELVSGVESDLGTVAISDMDDLLQYCYQVAGTVGLMMSRVLDARHPAASAHAIDLGIAMQLTNICRDVASDAVMGRRYLPASLVGDLTPSGLLKPTSADAGRIRSALATLLRQADAYYESGERGLAYLPPAARAGILLAARIYRAIGGTLRRRNLDYLAGRAVVGTVRKAGVTVEALVAFALHRRFRVPCAPHDAALHSPLHKPTARGIVWFPDHAD